MSPARILLRNRDASSTTVSSAPTSSETTTALIPVQSESDDENVSIEDLVPSSSQSSTKSTHTSILSLGRRVASPYYITLTISRPTTTYVTPILLGNNFPTSTSAHATSVAQAETPPESKVQQPGIPTGSIVGIIVGCLLGFGLLVGVFYVYLLRMRQFKRVRKRRKARSRRGSSSTGGAGPPPPPPPGPPPPDGGEGPFPPANP